MEHCPSDSKGPNDYYLRPLAKPNGNVGYAMQPMGRYRISTIVAHIAHKAGIEGKFSNHSLCATTATRLYSENVNELLIMECTGHSSNSVHNYKHTINKQIRDVSDVLYGQCNSEKSDDTDASSDTKLKCQEITAESTKVHVHKGDNGEYGSHQIVVSVNLNVPK